METKNQIPTTAAPQVREHPGAKTGATAVEGPKHHLPTKVAPQTRKVPGLNEPLVKAAEPGKVERRIVKPRGESAEGAKAD